jgi:DNA-binding transcriptional regulator YiaG
MNDASIRVKKLRKRYGLTQQLLADRIGVSFATVNRWENKHSNISNLALKMLNSLEKELEGTEEDHGFQTIRP